MDWNVCLYCNKEVDTKHWNSEWGTETGHHYKTCSCPSCGKKNWTLLSFYGSGHDNISNGKKSSLESFVDGDRDKV